MLFIAAPSFKALVKLYKKKGVLAILFLSIFAVSIESFAIVTGFPYGSFSYGSGLGPKVFDLAPPAIFLAWVPMVIGALESVKYYLGQKYLIPLTAVFLVIADLVIDPGAYALGIWIWHTPGFFYGVPLQNFFGWLLSGLLGVSILIKTLGGSFSQKSSSALQLSFLYTIAFWTGIAFFKDLYLPLVIGVAVCILILNSIIKAQNQQ
jgi:putative membrane protein